MKQVGSYEAKTHLARLLDEVLRGEKISITRKGIPVAILIPFPSGQKPAPEDAIQKLKLFRHNLTLKGLSLKEMIKEGRKY